MCSIVAIIQILKILSYFGDIVLIFALNVSVNMAFFTGFLNRLWPIGVPAKEIL